MYYNYYAPILDLSSITFTDNIAPYGENISAYAYQLVITSTNNISNQVSGQTIINPITVEVRDYYNNIINIDNST